MTRASTCVFRHPRRCASMASVTSDAPAKTPEDGRQRTGFGRDPGGSPSSSSWGPTGRSCGRFAPEPSYLDIPYTLFKEQVQAGNVEEVTSQGDAIQGTFKKEVTYPREGPNARTALRFQTLLPAFANPGLETLLEEKGVVINARPLDEGRALWQSLLLRLRPHAPPDRGVRLDEPAHDGQRTRALRARPQPRQALQRGGAEGHLRRRRGHRRRRERARRDRRLPEEPREVPAARRHRAEGRAAHRRTRHREDPPRPGGRRPGRRAVLQPERRRSSSR